MRNAETHYTRCLPAAASSVRHCRRAARLARARAGHAPGLDREPVPRPAEARSRARGWARSLPATYPKCPHINDSIPIAQTAPTLHRVYINRCRHCARVDTYRISISVSVPVNRLKLY